MTTLTYENPAAADSGETPSSFWARIAAELTEAISSGRYLPGQRLPSEHVLAEQFGVNRHTIRRSLASLSTQGLVRVARGSGTYVEEFAVDLVLGKRTRHQQSLSQAGVKGDLQVLSARTLLANGSQAAALQVPVRSRLLMLRVLGQTEHQPLHVSERLFPLPRFQRMEAAVRETGSITAGFLAHNVSDYTRRESRISADLPDATVAADLRQPINRPVLLVTSLNVDADGIPIEFSSAWFAGDRVKLTVSHHD